jgi:uncharacterized membrane protein
MLAVVGSLLLLLGTACLLAVVGSLLLLCATACLSCCNKEESKNI